MAQAQTARTPGMPTQGRESLRERVPRVGEPAPAPALVRVPVRVPVRVRVLVPVPVLPRGPGAGFQCEAIARSLCLPPEVSLNPDRHGKPSTASC